MIKELELQGEVNKFKVTVSYYIMPLMVIDSGYDFPIYREEGEEIVICSIIGRLPSDWTDQKDEYYKEIIEQLESEI